MHTWSLNVPSTLLSMAALDLEMQTQKIIYWTKSKGNLTSAHFDYVFGVLLTLFN